MSLPPEKRAAPDSAAPASKAQEVDRNDHAFKISVEMDGIFNVYPEKLRNMVQERHERLIIQIMTKFETGTPLEPRYTYLITRTRHSKPRDKSTDYEDPRTKRYPATSYASKEALKEFLVKVPAKKPKFVELKLPDGMKPMANPAFVQLHLVRSGEFGWGFDMCGCLLLQSATVEDGKLRHETIYVERKIVEAPKVEEDDDFHVIEDPNAAKE